jgi:hypothetical protein
MLKVLKLLTGYAIGWIFGFVGLFVILAIAGAFI